MNAQKVSFIICTDSESALHECEIYIKQLTVLFAYAPLLYQLIAIGRVTATKSALHNDLPQTGLGTNGGLDAFAGRLPVTDVVQQLVHMVIKPLLAFLGAPNLDAVVDEPFHNERCFVIAPAKAVKHENKKDVKGVQCRLALDFLYGVALLGGDLEAGHAFLGKLSNNVPTHLCGELMASLLLHGDVILFDLSNGRNTV